MSDTGPLHAADSAPSTAPAAYRASVTRPLVLAALVALCLALVYISPLRSLLSQSGVETQRGWLEGLGLWAPIGFTLVASAAIAVGAPRLLFAVVGGVAFGFLNGVLLAQASVLIGSLLTFRVARRLGQAYVEQRIGPRYQRFAGLMEHLRTRGIAVNVLVRSLPVGNCFLVNLFMGVSPITMRHFVLGTMIGTLPETLIYTLFGSSAEGMVALRLGTGAALLALLGITWYFLARRSALASAVADQITQDPP